MSGYTMLVNAQGEQVGTEECPLVTSGGGGGAEGASEETLAAIEALITTLNGHVDTLESGQATLNASITSLVNALATGQYERVAADDTLEVFGSSGAVGDIITHLLVIPATTSPGAVSIKDGTDTAITVFTGGASSVSNLVPFPIPLGVKSAQGAWQINTGSNVSVIACGKKS